MTRLIRFGVAAALLAGRLAGQQAPALLMRCLPEEYAPCLASTVVLSRDEAMKLARLDSTGQTVAWKARFGSDSLETIARQADLSQAAPVRLLVLVDVSGSMRRIGEYDPMGRVRAALRYFLRDLAGRAGGAVRLAMVPFGSVDVGRTIAAAHFTPPDSAQTQVEGFPEPDREDTGLYSAVLDGLRRLDAELVTAPKGTTGGLIVITDGTNDIGQSPPNDADLLPNSAFPEVQGAIARTPHGVWLVGLGSRVDGNLLSQLAGSHGKSYTISLSPMGLARTLEEIRNSLWTAWEIDLPLLSSGRADLARGFGLVRVTVWTGGAAEPRAIPWMPPLIAFPGFRGALTGLPAALALDVPVDRRLIVFGVFALFCALLWLWVPRLLWALPVSLVPVAAEAPPGAPARAAKPEPAPSGGLRRDVQEAPPRRPTDVTGPHGRRPTV